MAIKTMFAARTTNGTSAAVDIARGDYVILTTGTPNGATMTYEISVDEGVTYAPLIAHVNQTKAEAIRLPNCKLRAVVSNAGGSTNLNAVAAPVNT